MSKALEILKERKRTLLLIKACSALTKKQSIEIDVDIKEFEEAIAELEEFNKECENLVIESKKLVNETLDLGDIIIKQSKRIVELEKKQPDPDSLATLEATIRDYYVAKGNVVGSGNWGFQVSINSIYKWKILKVYFYENDIENAKLVFSSQEPNTKKMFDKAFAFFTCKG